MRFMRRASWFTVFLTLSLSGAELYYPAGIGVLNSEALVDAHFGDAAWKEVLPREERCTSLMGPSCFYRADSAVPIIPDSSTTRTQESSGLSSGDHSAQGHPEEALQYDVGIMAQYLQASQSQLGAVHGHSETLSEHWQRVGAAQEGKLDDVVHVKVGRGGSVRSVYDRTEDSRGLDQAVASVGSGTASNMCNADEIDQSHMHKGEQQPAMGAVQCKCEWSSSSDKAADASAYADCALASESSSEYTED